jgi:glyoxylase-like metal-dependent hydrolase (beta-lactamase superfamily II)
MILTWGLNVALKDVDGINLASDKHRWLDLGGKFAGFAECREFLYWVRNYQVVENDCSLQLGGVPITVVHLPGDRHSRVAFSVCFNR